MTEGGGGGGGGGGRGQKACGDNQLTLNQMDVNECLGSWLAYLQMLNGLCSAGTKLALSLQALLSGHESGAPAAPCRVTSQCLAGWEELTRATNVASHTVRKHVVTAMKDYEVLDSDGDKADILRDNLLTFINLQYQFCVACCKCLGSMAECSCTQDGSECDIAALQQCFERLYSSPPAAASASAQPGQRSPLPPSLFPLQVRRRWSETAATSADMAGGEAAEQAVRRWSMPWDCRHVSEWPPRQAEPGGAARARLRVPAAERSRSATPDARWRAAMSSQDGLREAIQLLSCRPGVRVYGGHVPGVTLTPCGLDAGPAWPDSAAGAAAAAAAAARAWPHRDSHSSDHSDHSTSHSTHSGLSGPRDSELSAGSGSAHGDSKDSVHSHSDYGGRGESDAGALELLSSRKNSSSTDSCVSAHSRSGSESAPAAGDSLRSNLYSMWSGSDLPFIRLPESSEIKDDSALV
ncbi:uncharacterized protein LOC131672343 [Phymastichus coffea]|uniref:uncharacterized protein LOC131672343 n=1 Tax=Phymastichus coffea TaxID=108790 RepID=UPI00273AB6A2|nr:uncharacterized protein LOC131672343 [Phymastichus coffea]XP_058805479.1 uncharacterized protein LOC131672343 [Phymastichus coffea]